MKIVSLVLRVLLGIALVVFGANKFFGFIAPLSLPAEAEFIFSAFLKSGYVLEAVGVVEVLVGVLLLINRYVALALVVLMPISINIILFHLALDPGNVGPGIFVFATNVYLMVLHIGKYKPLLQAK